MTYLPPCDTVLRVPNWVLKVGLKPSDALVFAALLDHQVQNREEGSPNLAWIMSRVGIGKRSLTEGLARLEEAGLIVCDRKFGDRTAYTFRQPPLAFLERGSGCKTAPVAKQHRLQNSTATGAETAPDRCRNSTTLKTRHSSKTLNTSSRAAECNEIFAHWQRVMGKPKAKPVDKRLRKIDARLNEGFGVQDIKLAIDGARQDEWIMGRNPQQTFYGDIVTVLRDGATLERHRDRAQNGPNKPPAKAVRGSAPPSSDAELQKLIDQQEAHR